jgi:hypothetical protein
VSHLTKLLPITSYKRFSSPKFKKSFNLKMSNLKLQTCLLEDPMAALFVSLKGEQDTIKKQIFISFCCKMDQHNENIVLFFIKTVSKLTKLLSFFTKIKKTSKNSDAQVNTNFENLDTMCMDLLHQIILFKKCKNSGSITQVLEELNNKDLKSMCTSNYLSKNSKAFLKITKETLKNFTQLFIHLLKIFKSSKNIVLSVLFEQELINRGFVSVISSVIQTLIYQEHSPSNQDPLDYQILQFCLKSLFLLSIAPNPKLVDQCLRLNILVLIKQTDEFLRKNKTERTFNLCLGIMGNVLDSLHRSELKNPLVMNLVNYVYLNKN